MNLKSLIITLCLLFITFAVDSQITFEKSFARGQVITTICATNTNYYVAGCDDTTRLSIYKLNYSGDTIWIKAYGASGIHGFTFPSKIIETPEKNLLIIGGLWPSISINSMYLLMIDTLGSIIWETTLFIPNTEELCGVSIAITPDNNYVATGRYWDNVTNNNNIIVAKIDLHGNFIWYKTFDYFHDHAAEVIIKSDIEYLICGTTDFNMVGDSAYGSIFAVDSSGNILWNKWYGNSGTNRFLAAKKLFDSTLVLTGYSLDTISGYEDMWIVKTDLSGNLIWEKVFQWPFREMIQSVEECGSNIYLAGGIESISHPHWSRGFMAELDSNGNLIWTKEYPNCTGLHEITIDNDNYIVGSGTTYYFNPYDDLYVIKLFLNGSMNSIVKNNLKNEQFLIYPNPTKEVVHIQNPNFNLFNNITIKLFDINSKLVHECKYINASRIIELPKLKSGVYLFQISYFDLDVVEKLFKTKLIITN